MIILFLSDNTPILINLSKELPHIDIYFIHDLHYGSELFSEKKWNGLKNKILSEEYSYICWIGDLMENALPNSKSSVFQQNKSPFEQQEFITEQLTIFKDKTLAVVPGNHEYNRTTKASGLYPLYDCCMMAGIGERYRDTVAFIDIGLGIRNKSPKKQVHYFGQIQHKAKDLKNISSADYTDGIDFFAFGHDHTPQDKPRAKLVFDQQRKIIYKRNVECVNSGSFCVDGGYGAKAGYRPQSDKMYELRLYGGKKKMETTGFYIEEK